MKKIFLAASLLLSVCGSISAQSTPQSAEEIMNQACLIAKKEQKNVFIIFHSSTCMWCEKFDAVLNNSDVKPLFDKNFTTHHMVIGESSSKKKFETPGGMEFFRKFCDSTQGVPFWMIFNADGNFITDSRLRLKGIDTIGRNTGCPATKEEIDYFIRCLQDCTSLTDKELKTIANGFGRIRNIVY